MRRRFFVEAFDGGRATLRGDSAHHAGRVLRAEPGQLYELSDGRQVWLGRIERVHRDALEFSLLEQIPAPPPGVQAALLLSVVKFDRFEWALEKATELGVADIVPIAATRSEKGLVSAAPKRAQRWEKILLESAQQSRRLRPPVLHPLECDSVDCLRRAKPRAGGDSQLRLFFCEAPQAPSLRAILDRSPGTRHLALAIGPEGGWTEEERHAASLGKWNECSLGANILRAETAVAAALASVNYAWGES